MYKRVSFALLRGAAPACAATACARPLLSAAIAAAPARLAGARGVRTLAFGDEKEVVHERSDFPKARLQAVLGKDTLAVLGYGPQVCALATALRACPRHRWREATNSCARGACVPSSF
jgi:ketol-acid reductoisomerase